MRPPTGLPAPEPAQQAHSARLTALIRAEIDAHGGALPFARFMELALYAPGLGYYSSGQRIFAAGDVHGSTSPGARGTRECAAGDVHGSTSPGARGTRAGAAGDFVTAPELGDVFARCLAYTWREVLRAVPGGTLLECGAGSGALAADLLRACEQHDALPARYLILELSVELRARQRATLQARVPHLAERVTWLERLPEAGFRGLVLANELLDALPVERFRVTGDAVEQLAVGWQDGRFAWCTRPAPAWLAARVRALGLPPGYTSELGLAAEAWVRSVGALIAHGALLVIDYGFARGQFYHPQRSDGTLMCHYRQRAHDDPLVLVGLQDITAHVDFSAIAQAGVSAGLEVLGYASQGAFLAASGLEEIVAESLRGEPRAHLACTAQIKRLTLPTEMGELFKVLALGRGLRAPLSAFRLRDWRARL